MSTLDDTVELNVIGATYDERYVDISIFNSVYKHSTKYRHKPPKQFQHCVYKSELKNYDKIKSKKKRNWRKGKYIQHVIEKLPCYARAVDMIILQGLNVIDANHANLTERSPEK